MIETLRIDQATGRLVATQNGADLDVFAVREQRYEIHIDGKLSHASDNTNDPVTQHAVASGKVVRVYDRQSRMFGRLIAC